MDRSLRDHIRDLDGRLKRLSAQSMENQLNRTERNHIESEIRVVNLALTHFRTALELERRLPES